MWDKYRKQFAYAADIEYGKTIEVIRMLTKQAGTGIKPHKNAPQPADKDCRWAVVRFCHVRIVRFFGWLSKLLV